MSLNIKIIQERKALYGDNLPLVAEAWSSYLGMDIEPQNVCRMMALLKRVRVENSEKVLRENFDNLNNEELVNIRNALDDSKVDRDNYEWIALNYYEYQKL